MFGAKLVDPHVEATAFCADVLLACLQVIEERRVFVAQRRCEVDAVDAPVQ